MKTQTDIWDEGVHKRIAKAIRRARQGNLTTEQLAAETKRLGYPISRSTLANYESARKVHLDVAELLVIAQALDVSPLELLFPGEPDQPVELLPNRVVSTLEASNWFVGNPKWLATLRNTVDMLSRALPPPSETSGMTEGVVLRGLVQENETK